MRYALLLLLVLQAPLAYSGGACVAVRVGYIDQHRPPYWLGEGEVVPEPPGASVDLIRAAVQGSGFNCPPILIRLPAARLKMALEAGDIDMTPIGEQPSYSHEIALPRDRDGNVDRNRALRNTLVVLVRSKDKVPANTNPADYLRGKTIGASQGSGFNPRLREMGLNVDDGARDLDRNLAKLKLGRVDAVVTNLVKPGHLDATLKRYGGSIVQLQQPLINSRLWMAFNANYYRAHTEQVEALWTWLDTNRLHLGDYINKYRNTQ
ncbi:substrate-binding periplasmic protein [Duganella fentianensis]|uniref:substrate-binding periplasmic protein n=1 Tax=Duganella fentianensis TaxID=2692177 RepID=UPI001E3AD71D|nr:transporter substrate-binding domain-containing protein [Duganella fentianensis]